MLFSVVDDRSGVAYMEYRCVYGEDAESALRFLFSAEDGERRLSVTLCGHRKLRNDLRRPTMEKIGFRTDVFNLDGIAESQRECIHWLLTAGTADKADAEAILTPEAIDLLATRLRTPAQIQRHLTLTLEAGYPAGFTPVPAESVESVLSRQAAFKRKSLHLAVC